MIRRAFIAGLGAAAWPVVARAQQGERRRVGVLMGPEENNPLFKSILTAFTQALAGLGWTDGRNVWIDVRWAGSDINGMGDNDAEIEAAIVALGREPGGGLVIMPDISRRCIARRSY
jgi:putative ABC transport system substrate-binding protein